MKKILIPILILGALPALRAQNAGPLNRQLEVTRAYEPTVNEATKLPIKPNMTDTVALRPELSYAVKAMPVDYGFQTTPFRPADVNVNDYSLRTPFYLKAALGFPFQSLLDGYYHSTDMVNGSLGAYINHYGSWSKIENDNGVKAPASQTFNKIGALGDRRFGRYTLEGELGYDYTLVSRYGYYTHGQPLPTDYDTTASGLRSRFSTLRGQVSFGDKFEDLSTFNFRVSARGAYFTDNDNYSQGDYTFGVDLGKRFGGKHDVTLHAEFDGIRGKQKDADNFYDVYDYDNDRITVAPLYHLLAGRFDFAVGVDYVFNRISKPDLSGDHSTRSYLFPRFRMSVDLTSGYFVPYVEIDGSLNSNDYRISVLENPYYIKGIDPNTAVYNGRVGFTGSFSSTFSYKVYGGASLYKDYLMPTSLYVRDYSYGERVTVLADSMTMWTVGVDLEGRVSGSFGVEASVQYRGYTRLDHEYVSGMPNLTARVGLRYNYQDKLILNLGATFLSNRHFASEDWGVLPDAPGPVFFEKVNATVDISLGAEYRLSKTLGVFLQGNNLANQKLYPYYHYRGLGINVLAGVKWAF